MNRLLQIAKNQRKNKPYIRNSGNKKEFVLAMEFVLGNVTARGTLIALGRDPKNTNSIYAWVLAQIKWAMDEGELTITANKKQ